MAKGYGRLALVILVAVAGCSKSNTVPLSPEAKTALEKEAPPSASGPLQINGPMPASLGKAYENVETLYGAVSSMDWASAASMIAALKSSLAQVRADLNPVTSGGDVRAGTVAGKEDMIDSGVDSLEGAIRARNRESARRESNRTTLPMAELAEMYGVPVPGELMMLKYYSRQLDIAASTEDAPLLKETADNVRRIWSGLRPAVEAQGGVTEARQFNDLVNDLEKSGPPGQIGALLRDRIYEIEEVLKR